MSVLTKSMSKYEYLWVSMSKRVWQILTVTRCYSKVYGTSQVSRLIR
jgi:hypothetical protein